MLNARYPHAHGPPNKKNSPPRTMWWKNSKKAQLFTLELFQVPAAAKSNQARKDQWAWYIVKMLPRPKSFTTAWTQEWTHNYHDSFCLFLFPIKEPNYTHTYKHIKIIIIDSTLTARWSNEWSTIKLCVSQALFAMMKNAQSLISFLQTRKLMIITTWRNLL